jgi:DNA-binding CsgD family transcriptional regulator
MLSNALSGAFDQLEAGFVAALSDGKIIHANRMAQDMMDAGWPILALNGYLRAEGREATAALLHILRKAAEPARGHLDVCLSGGATPNRAALASASPLQNGGSDGSGCVLAVFVTVIECREFELFPGVAECYGLTEAETRTLQHFSSGRDAVETALALGVKRNTVKTHLQNIFAKTGAPRQPRLVKLIHALRHPLIPPVAAAGAESRKLPVSPK